MCVGVGSFGDEDEDKYVSRDCNLMRCCGVAAAIGDFPINRLSAWVHALEKTVSNICMHCGNYDSHPQSFL